MGQVLATDVVQELDRELRQGLFTMQLWFKEECQDWDTNTGREDGLPYIRWRKASREEVREYCRENKSKNV